MPYQLHTRVSHKENTFFLKDRMPLCIPFIFNFFFYLLLGAMVQGSETALSHLVTGTLPLLMHLL